MEMFIMSRYEEIIVHLEGSQHFVTMWDVPFGLSEAGIIEGVGVGPASRSYVNKLLNQLQDEGLVFFDKKHILGGTGNRRRKAYFLTDKGQAYATQLIEVIKHE